MRKAGARIMTTNDITNSAPVVRKAADGSVIPAVEAVQVHKAFGPLHVLKGIDLTVMPGTVTVILGPSGSGKSTAASLLAGTLAGYRGSLTLNGVEVSDLSGETLAGAVTVIGASSHLFAGALRENLLMALPDDEIPDSPDSVDSRLWSALEQARIADFVHAQPNGLGMPIAVSYTHLTLPTKA